MQFKIQHFQEIKCQRQLEIVRRMIQYEGVKFTEKRLLDILQYYNPQMILHHNIEKFFACHNTSYLFKELRRLNEVYKNE